MTKRNLQEQMVLNQLMKGPRHGRVKADKKQQEVFARHHEDKVRWVLDRIPKTYSAAVGAVLVKSLIFYGVEKVEKLTTALSKLVFTGPEDPANLLWLYLLKPISRDETPDVYAKTVCAVKAYMDGRTVNRLTAVKGDIFEWDEDYTVPDELVPMNELVEAKIREEIAV